MKRFNYRAHPLTVCRSLFAAGGRKCRVEKSVGDARRSRENVIWTEMEEVGCRGSRKEGWKGGNVFAVVHGSECYQ